LANLTHKIGNLSMTHLLVDKARSGA